MYTAEASVTVQATPKYLPTVFFRSAKPAELQNSA
jgi:hypothetical protein